MSGSESWEPPASLGGSQREEDFGDTLLREMLRSAPGLRRPALGERLGGADGRRFEILAELGGGAMGCVYRARDEELQREVALKLLLPTLPLEEEPARRLLRQEARAIAQLDHDNIVRLYDVALWRGEPWEPQVPFLVMECLEGQSLGWLLRKGPPGLRRTLEIMRGIAAGLAHAHQRHVIHRDLKPSNVFLTREGTVKLLDFGLALLAAWRSSGAPSLPTAGTPPYMAPEQWRGEPLDERTDLWALGVLLYEMLTGELPYTAPSLEALRAQVLSAQPVPDVRERAPELPREVGELVAALVVKAPAGRLGSAAELLARVQALEERLGPWREAGAAPQRRQVTLISCRLARLGATPGEVLDPEDLSELEAAFHQRCSEILQRHGGSVLAFVGEEVLGCFGYPVAHEEDSSRAVQAGLELAEQVRPSGSLAVQVGLHTELVVLDDVSPELRWRTPAIQGEAPRVAAWLARQAEPGTVLLSGATHALVQAAFETAWSGERLFEGVSASRRVGAHRVLRARKGLSRFDRALGARELSPLVGRERELRRLLERWEQARGGQGALVLLTGEAGIGKSRLIRELRQRVGRESATRLRCQCWSESSTSAFFPVTSMLQHLLRLEPESSPQEGLRVLHEQLGALGLAPQQLCFIAMLLALPLENLPLVQLSPERQKEGTLEALAALLLRLAEQRPVLGVVEDLHWADPSTLELFGYLAERVAQARVLLVLSARSVPQPGLPERPWVEHLALERLPAALSSTLVREAAQGHRLPEEVVRRLVEKTDGVPLFVEELTRRVVVQLESGPRQEAGALLSAVPASLHELLLARLDVLPPRRRALAQLCAVVGREFSHALMATLTRRSEAALHEELEALVEAGLLVHPEDSRGVYQFRHALIQEVAYQSLLRGTRRQHHRRIAQALEERFADVVEAQPELLAHHYTEAGEVEPAVSAWARAGERAALRSANREAVSHFSQALQLLGRLPDPALRTREELRLLIALGIPLVQVHGYHSPEVERTYERARQLLGEVGEALPRLELSWWGPFAYYFARLETERTHELGEHLVALGRHQRDRQFLCLGHRMLAMDFFTWGRMEEARVHVGYAVGCSDTALEEHRRQARVQWVAPRALALALGACVSSVLGLTGEARRRAEEARELGEHLEHPHTLACVLTYGALASQFRREPEEALRWAEQAQALSLEHWYRLWQAWSAVLHTWALAELGRPGEALERMHRALERWRASGIRAGLHHHLGMLAEIHLRLGEPERALATLGEALEYSARWGERFYEAELHRLRGQAHAWLGHEEQARTCWEQALRVARAQGAWAFEQRALQALQAEEGAAHESGGARAPGGGGPGAVPTG